MVILGAGIAGLITAWSLSKIYSGIKVFDMAKKPGYYSTGRNAAIMRTYEADPALSPLMEETLAFLQTKGLIRQDGLAIIPHEASYSSQGFYPKELKLGGENFIVMQNPQNGVIDVDKFCSFLLKEAKERKVEFYFNKKLEKTELNSDKTAIQSLQFSTVNQATNTLKKVETIEKPTFVINAMGCWAGNSLPSRLPLIPHKRHLYLVKSRKLSSKSPIFWDETREFYIRKAENSYIATHGDQTPSKPGDYQADPQEEKNFIYAWKNVFPKADVLISDYWSCLRTHSLDNRPVIGFDEEIKNLFWSAGWGGRGMSLSIGLSNIIQKAFTHNQKSSPFSPSRF